MKRLTIGFVAALFVLSAATTSLRAVGIGSYALVTGAGNGVFPAGAQFSGVKLSGSTFGEGLEVSSGSGLGFFHTVLTGTSVSGGVRQNITLNGAVSSGTVNADGSVTFGGTATLNLGDGSLPTTVPFSATVTTAGLTLVIGTTTLPSQTVDPGSIYIG
jgi:hypothetical protein